MNFTYFRFTFINTIKKRPVWITWLLFLLTCTCFIIILPAVAIMSPLQVWANTTMAVCQSFLGMTVALFTAVLAIHIFKDSNEEGTELIVISKPISRFKIVLTKFFVFAFFCLLVNITSLIITAFTWFLPKSDPKFYWQLIVSMFVGNLVSFGVFGGISILLSVNFAKAGVIITDIMISLILIIYQALSLFVFAIPSKSLIDNHKMTAPSYILSQRDLKTGEYTEDGLVGFETSTANKTVDVPNESICWQDTKDYWENEILKGDPTTILNFTDLAGQISLSYLSIGLDQYAYREGRRTFAISRFYNYKLGSPASPEIISGVENKKSIDWLYTNYDYLSLPTEDPEAPLIRIFWPQGVKIAGISPSSLNRIRGFGDKLPIGYIKDRDHLLSNQDVFLEPEQWQKYAPAFDTMYDTIYLSKYYECPEYIVEDQDYFLYPSIWCASDNNLSKYYQIVWSCFTGNSTDEAYLGPDSPMKEYSQQFFDINTVNDLNERFLQYKYYSLLKLIQDQKALLENNGFTEELEAKQKAVESKYMEYARAYVGTKDDANNWFSLPDPEAGYLEISFLEPNTRMPNITLMHTAYHYLMDDIDPEQPEIWQPLSYKCTLAQYVKMTRIYDQSVGHGEDYLFSSLEKPTRSAARNGDIYCFGDAWVPYYQTILNPGNGHNLKYFFYTSENKTKFWAYAVFWSIVSLGMLTGACVIYNKHDVK